MTILLSDLRYRGDLGAHGVMAARFQVISMARSGRLPVSPQPDAGTGSSAQRRDPWVRGFAWRFMSANHRNLATSAHTFADVESCLATIHTLQQSLPLAIGHTVRNQNRQWIWRVQVNNEVLATAARSYSRQQRAQLTCDIFLRLVAQTAPPAPAQMLD